MQSDSSSLLSDEDPQAAYMTLSDNQIRNMWVTGDFHFLFQLKMNTKTVNILWKDVLDLDRTCEIYQKVDFRENVGYVPLSDNIRNTVQFSNVNLHQ